MTFIDRLLQVMKEKNISIYRLSKDLGLSDSLISKWKKKPNIDPSASTVYKIAEYLQVNIYWLLTGEGDINAPQITDELKQEESGTNEQPQDEPQAIPKDKVKFTVMGYGSGMTTLEVSKENWDKAWALMEALEEMERKRRNEW